MLFKHGRSMKKDDFYCASKLVEHKFSYFIPYMNVYRLCIHIVMSDPEYERGIVMVRISEFQIKDVVNISDGKKLGNIGDIEINLETGKIETIIIGNTGRLLGFFGREEEIAIPWNQIVKIGTDVILVRHQVTKFVQKQISEPQQ